MDNQQKPRKSNKFGCLVVIGIIALLWWWIFGGDDSKPSNEGEENLITVVDSTEENNSQPQKPSQGEKPGPATPEEVATLRIDAPTEVTVGEEFDVVYKLSTSKGADFKAKDIDGCRKLSGPKESKAKKGVEYTLSYKAEKAGEYTIPSATVKVDGKAITSKSQALSILSNNPSFTFEEVESVPAGNRNDNGKNQGNQQNQGNQGNQQNQETKPQPVAPVKTINGYEYVDLGLPSGTKWAAYNVGATAPEQYGSYFAWGETKPKSVYSKQNCTINEVCFVDLLNNGYVDIDGILTRAHDPASQNWGGTWRTPTRDQINELFKQTDKEKTTINGVPGIKFKSKKNNNSIFLPWAGVKNGSNLEGDGRGGSYWTSLQEDNIAGAYALILESQQWAVKPFSRHMGRSIRPVSR